MTLATIGIRPGPSGFAWLRERIAAAQAGDPLAPVTVIVPNHYVGLWLRREIAQTGYANVRFEILARLAERLGARSLAEQARAPLRPVVEDGVIRVAIAETGGRFGQVSTNPALVDTLRDLFRSLREHEVTADQLGRWSASGRTADASLAAFATYERLIEESRLYDDRAALDAASTAADDTGLREVGVVVIYLPARLSPAAVRFARALAARTEVNVALAVAGDAVADEQARANAAALGAGRPAPAPSDNATERRVLLAPDSSEEVRAVVRDVLADLDSGVPLNRIGILYRAREPYAELVRETLTAAGLPWAALEGKPLGDSVVARALVALLGLRDRDLARVDVLEWRSNLPHAGRGDVSFAEWNRLTREAGIVRGAEQWRERLGRLADELSRAAESAESEAARDHLTRRSDRAARVSSLVAALAAATEPPAERTWPGYVEWARALRQRFVHPHRDPDEEDAAKLVDDAIGALSAAAPLGTEIDSRVFRHALDAALRGQRRPQGRIGVGVVVGNVAVARGLAFDRLYFVGMADGLFPPRRAPDPIFPDDDPLDRRTEWLADERSAFLAAQCGADGGVISCSAPVWDADVRPVYAAPWLIEIAQQLAGEPLSAAELRSARPRSWRRLPSPEGALAAVKDPLDLAERRVAEARAWRMRGGLEGSALALRTGLPLGRALELRAGRQSSDLTNFDGNVANDVAASPRLRSGLATGLLSASAIERWCTCPFHYFLGRVLYIEETAQPEDDEAWTILPATRGSLIHDVLERFMSELVAAGPSRAVVAYTRDDHARLDAIAAEVFSDLEVRGVTGYRLAWENERAVILRDLHTFLVRDEQHRRERRDLPAYFEQGFGMPTEDSWPEATIPLADGRSVRLRGAIDRIDLAPDLEHPRSAVVIDYKTGVVETGELRVDPVRGGRNVQLAIYSLVVRDHLRALGASEPEVTAAYWQIVSKHKFAYTDVPTGPTLDMRLRDILDTVHAGIAKGAFPQRPGDEQVRPDRITWVNCAYCEYDRVCPAGRAQLAERKESDPAVKLHRGLTKS